MCAVFCVRIGVIPDEENLSESEVEFSDTAIPGEAVESNVLI